MFQSSSTLCILVIDKNVYYRRVIRQYLLPYQLAEMIEAETSLDAISLLLTKPFDLLVADWDALTSNDGALLELIAQRAKAVRRKMPTMAMMARPTEKSVLQASRYAIDVVLRKPFSMTALQARANWLVRQIEEDIPI